eukprot:9665237-Heterocapsa_arctica.AAC.1
MSWSSLAGFVPAWHVTMWPAVGRCAPPLGLYVPSKGSSATCSPATSWEGPSMSVSARVR